MDGHPHWHFSIENVVFIGIASVVFVNVVRVGAGFAVKRGGALEKVGSAVGALVR